MPHRGYSYGVQGAKEVLIDPVFLHDQVPSQGYAGDACRNRPDNKGLAYMQLQAFLLQVCGKTAHATAEAG